MRNKNIFLLSIVILLFTTSCNNKDPSIIGRWETKSKKGNILVGVFKADDTYEGYINNNMFTKGTYSFKDSIFTFEDDKMATACTGIKGSYKLTFLADTAMRFNVINDNCTPRKEGTDGVVLVRMKE